VADICGPVGLCTTLRRYEERMKWMLENQRGRGTEKKATTLVSINFLFLILRSHSYHRRRLIHCKNVKPKPSFNFVISVVGIYITKCSSWY
jgi:hypothetical protein